jgi:hypothetical protein
LVATTFDGLARAIAATANVQSHRRRPPRTDAFAKLIEGRAARSLPILVRRTLSWKNLTSAPDLNSGVCLMH